MQSNYTMRPPGHADICQFSTIYTLILTREYPYNTGSARAESYGLQLNLLGSSLQAHAVALCFTIVLIYDTYGLKMGLIFLA